jgi:coenzyme Q-binding protein COQ10
MKHLERQHSTYAPAQLFDLVADIERYPEFVPWVMSAKIFRRKDKTVWTDLTIGTSLLYKRFTTEALLDRPHRIEIKSRDPMFESFEQGWTFERADQGGTDITYDVDIKFKSRILHAVLGVSFTAQADVMVKAYMRRARRLYGPAQISARGQSARSG